MIEAKRSIVNGLAVYGLSYDDVLHGALRRWRTRLCARRAVRTRHATILLADGVAALPLRCAVRTWRRLLAHTQPTPHRRPRGDGAAAAHDDIVVVDVTEGGLMVPD